MKNEKKTDITKVKYKSHKKILSLLPELILLRFLLKVEIFLKEKIKAKIVYLSKNKLRQYI